MFSLKLKELRAAKGITQVQLAQELSVSIGAVGNWEAGKRTPDHETMIKIAEHFNVSVDYLLGRTESITEHKQKSDPRLIEFTDLFEQLDDNQKKIIISSIKGILEDK